MPIQSAECKVVDLMLVLGIISLCPKERHLRHANFLAGAWVVWKTITGICFTTLYTEKKIYENKEKQTDKELPASPKVGLRSMISQS